MYFLQFHNKHFPFSNVVLIFTWNFWIWYIGWIDPVLSSDKLDFHIFFFSALLLHKNICLDWRSMCKFQVKKRHFPRVFIFVSFCARFIYMRTHLHADNSSNRIERSENSGCRNFQEIWYKEASNTIEMKSTQTHSRTQLLHTTLHRNNSFFNWNHWTVAKFKSHSNCRRNACITQKYLIHTSLCYDITSICTHVLLQGQRVRARLEYEFHALCNTKPLYVYILQKKLCALHIHSLSSRDCRYRFVL